MNKTLSQSKIITILRKRSGEVNPDTNFKNALLNDLVGYKNPTNQTLTSLSPSYTLNWMYSLPLLLLVAIGFGGYSVFKQLDKAPSNNLIQGFEEAAMMAEKNTSPTEQFTMNAEDMAKRVETFSNLIVVSSIEEAKNHLNTNILAPDTKIKEESIFEIQIEPDLPGSYTILYSDANGEILYSISAYKNQDRTVELSGEEIKNNDQTVTGFFNTFEAPTETADPTASANLESGDAAAILETTETKSSIVWQIGDYNYEILQVGELSRDELIRLFENTKEF